MKRNFLFLIPLFIFTYSCDRDDFNDRRIEIPKFDVISTIDFADRLSAYNIFDGAPKNLIPAAGFETISINAKLFTDYAYKQRLIKVPYGTQLKKSPDHELEFPNGTLLTKTFYYYNDERDTSQGRNIIETRLLIKDAGKWNAATYRWNDMQTDAILEKNGYEKQISWINQMGHTRTTSYKIPTSNECIACHLSNQSVIPLGATIKNLNTLIKQNNKTINQLIHFQNIRILNDFPVWDAPFMVDYNDPDASLSDRGRAYLAINCAHCHNPTAWDIPSLQGFDFRYETPFHQTGIFLEQEEIIRNVSNQRMPFIGTTMLDEEGVTLLLNYIQSLQN